VSCWEKSWPAPLPPPQRDGFDPDSTDLTGYPGLLRLQPELTREQAAGQFEDSLADMVRQVQASLERADRASSAVAQQAVNRVGMRRAALRR